MRKRDRFRGMAAITGTIMVIGSLLWQGGFLPLAGYEAMVVVCFPVFLISLFLWWMAREHGEDIPFVGY